MAESSKSGLTPCYLLALPAELREEIYKLVSHPAQRTIKSLQLITDQVVVQPKSIRVDHTGFSRSALLLTNKTIRSECMSIFYSYNQFRVNSRDFNSGSFSKWTKHIYTINVLAFTQIHHKSASIWNWDNVLVWLKRVHANELQVGSARSVSELRQDKPEKSAAQLGFRGMLLLTLKLRGLPWEEVKTLLDDQHEVLKATGAV